MCLKAWMNLRYTLPERRRLFHEGLSRLGYQVMDGITNDPGENDILVIWNRVPSMDLTARLFESRNLKVLCAENASWGNDFAGDRWYTLVRTRHNTKGMFPVLGGHRWDDLGVNLSSFRTQGETVLLPQRGIGSPPTAMPAGWLPKAIKKYGGRVRKHPGKYAPPVSIEDDLKHCGKVVTWGSGAAIKALMMGIPVISEMPDWIGEQDNTEDGRLQMFRELAWGQTRLSEIESGEAFERLLQ